MRALRLAAHKRPLGPAASGRWARSAPARQADPRDGQSMASCGRLGSCPSHRCRSDRGQGAQKPPGWGTRQRRRPGMVGRSCRCREGRGRSQAGSGCKHAASRKPQLALIDQPRPVISTAPRNRTGRPGSIACRTSKPSPPSATKRSAARKAAPRSPTFPPADRRGAAAAAEHRRQRPRAPQNR